MRWLLPVLLLAIPLAAELRELTILHTNDLHARLLPDDQKRGGFAHLATVLREQRANCRKCLYLDAGDVVQGSPVSSVYQGLPIIEIFNRLKPDAQTLGNHEFDYGWQRILEFRKKAKYPVLSANIVDNNDSLLADKAHLLKTVNGIKVGIIGLMLEKLVPGLAPPQRVAPWQVSAPVAAARRSAADLKRRGADVIILLAHMGTEEATRVAQQSTEFDVILHGHDHNGMQKALTVNNSLLARVLAYGREVGRLDLTIDTQANRITQSKWTRIPVDAKTITPAADVAAHIEKWEAKLRAKVDRQVGTASRAYTQQQLKPILERIMKEATGADLAFMNQGGIRDSLAAGPILERHIWNMLPFDNFVVTGSFPGERLPESIRKANGIDPAKTYRFATLDFVAQSNPTWKLVFPETGALIRDVVLDYIRRHKAIE
jgi:2',3'-cyclic-nucleotide 2'-phosphodiesterase (5'-nucleotidase family)